MTALGDTGPTHVADEVHCAPLNGPPMGPHFPTGGHLVRSGKPLAPTQAMPVMLHTGLMSGQSTAELHAEWVFEHVSMFEQQNCVWPWLQAVAKHAGGGLIFVPLHVPKVAWQPQLGSTPLAFQLTLVQAVVQAVFAGDGEAQVPLVRHCASAAAWVAPTQGCCDQGCPLDFEQVPGHWVLNVQAAPPCAHLPPVCGQAALAPFALQLTDEQLPPGHWPLLEQGFPLFAPPLQIC